MEDGRKDFGSISLKQPNVRFPGQERNAGPKQVPRYPCVCRKTSERCGMMTGVYYKYYVVAR
jgi:hypothetical protein